MLNSPPDTINITLIPLITAPVKSRLDVNINTILLIFIIWLSPEALKIYKIFVLFILLTKSLNDINKRTHGQM